MQGPGRKLHSPGLPGTRLLPISSLQRGSGQRDPRRCKDGSQRRKLPDKGKSIIPQRGLHRQSCLGIASRLSYSDFPPWDCRDHSPIFVLPRILHLQGKGQVSHRLPIDTLQQSWKFQLTARTQALSFHRTVLTGPRATANHSQSPAAFSASVLPAPGSSRAPCSLSHAWHSPYCTLSQESSGENIRSHRAGTGLWSHCHPLTHCTASVSFRP